MELICSNVREVEVRYRPARKRAAAPRKIANSREVYDLVRERLQAERVEVFEVLLVDSKNQIMAIDPISRGSLSTSIVHPREVFTNAVRFQAAALLLVHNHPSGDPTPSREDRECTERLWKAGQILGIRVLDHVIVGSQEHYSFADAGVLGIQE